MNKSVTNKRRYMKQLDFYLSVVAILCMVSIKSFAADIAVENEDGVTIYYSYINDGKELAVVQPTNDVICRIPGICRVTGSSNCHITRGNGGITFNVTNPSPFLVGSNK